MDADQFRKAAHAAVEEIIEYYQTLPNRRVVADVTPGYLAPLLPTTAPTDPEPWPKIQADIASKIIPGLTHWQSPNFMAFFPANATYPSMLGELYSAAFTAPAFNWLCSPAVTELETVVLDWLCQVLGLPECFLSKGEGGGVIQGSASEAIVTVMVAARDRYLREATKDLEEGEEKERRVAELRGKLVALGSEQSHSSTQKGAIIAGTRYASVPARIEDDFGMTGKSLKEKILELKSKGQEPYYLTTSLGTTTTCAVDKFEEIAEVLKEFPGIWVHVDAAYAGAALVLPEVQHFAKSFAAFDSFEMNMHKWLLTNFDAGCLFIRHRRDLIDALSITPSYLRNQFSDSGLVTDYRDWQIPLGRRFRSLKIWFVMRSYGISGLQNHIRHHLQLSQTFVDLVKSRPDMFEILVPPAFALTVLTVKPRPKSPALTAASKSNPMHERFTDDFTPDADAQRLVEQNRITKDVYELVNSKGEIFLTNSVIAGTYVIRVVAASPQVEEKYVKRAFEILVECTNEVLDKEGNGPKQKEAVNGSAK